MRFLPQRVPKQPKQKQHQQQRTTTSSSENKASFDFVSMNALSPAPGLHPAQSGRANPYSPPPPCSNNNDDDNNSDIDNTKATQQLPVSFEADIMDIPFGKNEKDRSFTSATTKGSSDSDDESSPGDNRPRTGFCFLFLLGVAFSVLCFVVLAKWCQIKGQQEDVYYNVDQDKQLVVRNNELETTMDVLVLALIVVLFFGALGYCASFLECSCCCCCWNNNNRQQQSREDKLANQEEVEEDVCTQQDSEQV